jgi:hypothetical protein
LKPNELNKLSVFVQDILMNGIPGATALPVSTADTIIEEAIPLNEPSPAGAGDNLSRQLCRQWLKYKYLSIGACCPDGVDGKGLCGRQHTIPSNTGHLYSDYSFKGLSKLQRKSILDAIRLEQSGHPENINMDQDVTDLPDRKRAAHDDDQPTQLKNRSKMRFS